MTEPRINPAALLRYLKLHAAGKDNARPGMDIATYFGTLETKRVRESVNLLRTQGELIGSCHSGYYIPATREEAIEGLAFITTIFEPLRRAVEGYRGAIDREFGPNTLFDEQDVA